MRAALPVALVTSLVLAPLLSHAQPAHCERPLEGRSWPSIREPEGDAPASPVGAAIARARVARFRRQWRRVPHRSDVLRSFTECMLGSLEHFVVQRVGVSVVRERLEALRRQGFSASILRADPAALPEGWLWEVYWGGASRRHPPSGAISGYLSADGRTLVAAVHWPEG